VPLRGSAVLAYAHGQGLVEIVAQAHGEQARIAPGKAALLMYFRNNVLHAFAFAALVAARVAGLLAAQPAADRAMIEQAVAASMPGLRSQFHMSLDGEAARQRLQAVLDFLLARQMLVAVGARFELAPAGSAEALRMQALLDVAARFDAAGRLGAQALSVASLRGTSGASRIGKLTSAAAADSAASAKNIQS
jgi:glycerol-3-phosphate O-acyltransferase